MCCSPSGGAVVCVCVVCVCARGSMTMTELDEALQGRSLTQARRGRMTHRTGGRRSWHSPWRSWRS